MGNKLRSERDFRPFAIVLLVSPDNTRQFRLYRPIGGRRLISTTWKQNLTIQFPLEAFRASEARDIRRTFDRTQR